MMKKKIYHKLVRDKIPNILDNDGVKHKTHVVKGRKYGWYLKRKLLEEFNEFMVNPSAEELADILEVLEYLRKFYNIDLSEIKECKDKKKKERGGFDKGIILDWVKE